MQAPFGSWKSPITTDLIVSKNIGFAGIDSDADNLYWVETRPQEAGRYVVVRRDKSGKEEDITPAPFNARTRVHEYGGAAFFVENNTVYFSNYADQRLYAQDIGGKPSALTPEGPFRFADCLLDEKRNQLVGIREDHSESEQNARNEIVRIALEGSQEITPIVSGADFYTAPRINPTGTHLAWLSWDHPNMPWDGCELWVGELDGDGNIANKVLVAGGKKEAIFQPAWGENGELFFVSDRTGWGNLYRWKDNKIDPLFETDKNFALPYWQFGMATYCQVSKNQLLCTFSTMGVWQMGLLDTESKTLDKIRTPFSDMTSPIKTPSGVFFQAASPTSASKLCLLNLESLKIDTIKESSHSAIDDETLSVAEPVSFESIGGATAHAFFYAPKNKDFNGLPGEKPPLLVKSHGGPTSATSSSLNLKIQYWTSRGFAVLDVNYGGSTGYGRPYQERLKDNWGIVDVADCSAGAQYLSDKGLVDPERMAISGGSAGGFTTLAALTFTDRFKAGASHYGIGDLEALVKDTHKFESRYLDGLIGPYPERIDLYNERSPIHHVDQLSCPIIFLQGAEDKVVLPNQAESMVAALKEKGIRTEYVLFEGEQHGFRQAKNIKTALEREMAFYGSIFGFTPNL